MFKNVMIPTEGSPPSRRAVERVVRSRTDKKR